MLLINLLQLIMIKTQGFMAQKDNFSQQKHILEIHIHLSPLSSCFQAGRLSLA